MKIIKISINSDDETDFSSQPLLDSTFLVELVNCNNRVNEDKLSFTLVSSSSSFFGDVNPSH